MKLCVVVLLLLPVVSLAFSPPRNAKRTGLETSSKENLPSDPAQEEEEYSGISNPDINTPLKQPREPVVLIVKGRKWKNKRQKCLNGSKSRKCKKILRKMAKKQRKMKRRRLAAANLPISTRIQFQRRPKKQRKLKLLLEQCRRQKRHGIESAITRCAENTDVDTFMDFAVLVLSNSSFNEQTTYPEDELQEIQNILLCLGNRKRWHRTDDMEEVLAELRIKQAFTSIEPCVNKVGRNCSWQEEEATGWLNCVESKCEGRRLTQIFPQPDDVLDDIPESTPLETEEDDDFTTEAPPEFVDSLNIVPGDYDYTYVDEELPSFNPFSPEDDYELEEEPIVEAQ